MPKATIVIRIIPPIEDRITLFVVLVKNPTCFTSFIVVVVVGRKSDEIAKVDIFDAFMVFVVEKCDVCPTV